MELDATPVAHATLRRALSVLPSGQAVTASEWCSEHVQLPGSVLVDRYTPEATPWTRDIVDSLGDPTVRSTTVMAPVQSGKSVIGEAAACYWLATSAGGDLQWNWENDTKAKERYEKRIEKILRACHPLRRRWPRDANKAKRGLVVFPHANLTVQGQEVASNLDSDSVRFQVNEEIHSWHEGRLDKATARLTAVWNAKQLNLSNAGVWKCKRGPHEYDYEALAKTVYYECEHCSHRIYEHDRRTVRCGYVQCNDTPLSGHRSFSWDAVAVHYISWLSLIQQKHQALKALAYGDRGPWYVYITERECRPWRQEDEPFTHKINISSGVKKQPRDGAYEVTIGTVDVQRGGMTDRPHHWVVVRGYNKSDKGVVTAALLHEGRIDEQGQVDVLMSSHSIQPSLVFVDSGDQTESVYQWCASKGYTPIKGMRGDGFVVEVEGDDGEKERRRRIWRCDPDRPVEVSTSSGRVLLPLILYAKEGIRDRLLANQESGRWDWQIPEDVSEDFVAHYAAEQTRYDAHTGKRTHKQVKARNDLYVCDAYQALGYEIWSYFN